MIEQQFSKHFDIITDKQFKDDEFEKKLGEYIIGFVQHYPNMIEKKIKNGVEVWIFRFSVNER
jgi:hypothetical protein